jgi:hypothetical protein
MSPEPHIYNMPLKSVVALKKFLLTPRLLKNTLKIAFQYNIDLEDKRIEHSRPYHSLFS